MGRILARLKPRGVLQEATLAALPTRKRAVRRPYAVRKPKGYAVDQPGDHVQVDTLNVRPVPGVVLIIITARGIVSRRDVLEARTRTTATTAAGFLDRLVARISFPVRAIQVDGGPEFQVAYEEAWQPRGTRLFLLPPRSPKLNGFGSALSARTQRSSMRSPLVSGGCRPEPRAPGRVAYLQHSSSAPGPSAISLLRSSSANRKLSEMEPSVTTVLKEHIGLTADIWPSHTCRRQMSSYTTEGSVAL